MSDRGPYTYVTVTMQPDEAPCLVVSFYTADLHIRAGVIDGRRPYFTVSSDEADVWISTTGGGQVTGADLRTARLIFDAAARYLADCERLHIHQSAQDATDAA
ncbi:hypothetical protein [Thermoactinospora rubra]|uniref:hypothetical protein n=1 Tax=Thermoactinospora rubra TaxID=1088767 RepID=UPI000A101FF1|nr:hypothetical protein [Thermoactinospora rubra]